MFGCNDSCGDNTNCNTGGLNCNNLLMLMLMSNSDINICDLLLLQFLQKGMNKPKDSCGCGK
ncbi:MAG: hypothetical protein LBF68_07085 [Christensenellaceae bacterium]|jgi:hypothetical protein|nr:hypothetical protein [Christensenellaceae bacterium]